MQLCAANQLLSSQSHSSGGNFTLRDDKKQAEGFQSLVNTD